MSKILVISPTPTHPTWAGNRARILCMMQLLIELGHEVHFLHLARDPADNNAMQEFWGDRYYSVKYKWPKRPPDQRVVFGTPDDDRFKNQTRDDRKENLKYWWKRLRHSVGQYEWPSKWNWDLDEWYNPTLSDELKTLQKKHNFNVVIVQYVYMSSALLAFDNNVLKMIDCHDVFSDRYKQFLENNERPAFFSVSPRDEARGLNRADVIMAIQPQEQQYLQSIADTRVISVGHVVSARSPRLENKHNNILFVGSPNSVNVNGVEFFMKDVLPIVQQKCPNAKLIVAGRVCEKIGEMDGCVKLGEISDLAEAYDQADIVINPRKFGTGLSIKSVEALSFGIPLVATPAGSTGMENVANEAFILAEEPDEIADAIVKLLQDKVHYRKFAQAGHEYAVKYNAETTDELTAILDNYEDSHPNATSTVLVLATDTDFWHEDVGSRVRIASLYRYLEKLFGSIHIYYTRNLKESDNELIAERFSGMHIHTAPPEQKQPINPPVEPQCSIKKNTQHQDKKLSDFSSHHHIKHFRTLCEKIEPGFVLFEFIRLSYLLDAFENYTKQRPVTIIDTIDVMHIRAERFHQQGQPHWVDITHDEERNALNRFDHILAIQSEDAQVFKEMLPEKSILVVGHPISAHVHSESNSNVIRVAYVASGGVPNQEAIRNFLDKVWPEIQRLHKDKARFIIAGRICDFLEDERIPDGVELNGYIEDLVSFYATIDIVVNPVTFGGGLKIKCVEALAHGKALVTTSVGAEGIEDGANVAFIISSSPIETIMYLDELIKNPEQRKSLGENALEFARKAFSEEASFGSLRDIIKK